MHPPMKRTMLRCRQCDRHSLRGWANGRARGRERASCFGGGTARGGEGYGCVRTHTPPLRPTHARRPRPPSLRPTQARRPPPPRRSRAHASVRKMVANSRVSRDTSICLTATGSPNRRADETIDDEPWPMRRPTDIISGSMMMKRGTAWRVRHARPSARWVGVAAPLLGGWVGGWAWQLILGKWAWQLTG